MTPARRPVALTVAGLDPGGGAGIVADSLRLAREGVHPLAVASALTVQDSRAVQRVQAVEVRLFRAQIRALFDDFPVRAVKTGLLPSAAHVDAVAECVPERVSLVVDPVLASSGGVVFLDRRGRRRLVEALFPRATLVTPNLPEARALVGSIEADLRSLRGAAEALRALGPRAALLKGGHGEGPVVVDVLASAAGLRVFRAKRVPVTAHGTGCALSAAIAARLARGDSLVDAVGRGIARVRADLRAAVRLGRGRPTLGL